MKNLTIFLLFFLLKTAAFSQEFDKLIEEGDVFYNDKNYEKAAEIFTKAIAAAPQNSKGYWYRGDAYMENRNYTKAIADYTKAIEIEPGFWSFYKKRGDCYYALEQYKPAAKDFGKALELKPTESILWLYRGDAYLNLKQNDLACADYAKAFELGDVSAKTQAKSINCDWAKAADVPCVQGEQSIRKVEIDPFTGAVFISKGLSYDKFEFKPEDEVGYITGPRIGKDQSFDVKILEPQGFCADGDGNVFVGIGLILYDENQTELANIADIYAEKNEGLPAEFLKSLTATLSFTQLETGKNYLVKVRFFDKRGTGELFVEMPFISALKTDMFNNTSTTVNTLGEGIKSAAVGAQIKDLSFKNTTTKAAITNLDLKGNQRYSINLQGVKSISSNAQYLLRIVNEIGETIHTETGKAVLKGGNLDVNIPAGKLLQGNYTIWVKLFDATQNNLGVAIPVYVQ
ncbi:MAG: tetratricopeptide repeat protein [Bacteroidota bacterium]